MGVFRETKKSRTLSVFHSRPPSIPAKAGISRGGIVRHASPQATLHFRFAEFPADAGRDSRFRGNGIWGGNGKVGSGSIFLPSAACGGGCERDSGRGGWSVSDDGWDFATPQKFALRIFTPPRKRRGVRFMLGRGRQRLHCTAYYLPGKTTSSVFRNSGVTCAPAPLSL